MRIDLTFQMPTQQATTLAGTLLDARSFDTLIREDADVYCPDGRRLLVFRKQVLDRAICRSAYGALRHATSTSHNRGLAAGAGVNFSGQAVQIKGPRKLRAYRIKMDGRMSRTNEAQEVQSGIIGHFDRNSRFPYCRLTAFNLEKPQLFAQALPYIRAVDQVFARELPERYGNQKRMIARTHPDFYIHGTVFTTLTVNRNWQTAVHQDKGDYRAGFGVMAVLQGGRYDGCFLVFPRYRIAVDMRSQDVLLANVHEWHGNTPLIGRSADFERISCVFYYRAKMVECGSAVAEQARAKARRPVKDETS